MRKDGTDLNERRQCNIKRMTRSMMLDNSWSLGSWDLAPVLQVDQFHASSSSHRPMTTVKLLHDEHDLHVAFRVQDRFVRCVHTEYQSDVYLDSCVEFFLQPVAGGGYFNFEINCGGALLLYFIEDPAPGGAKRFRQFCPVPEDIARLIKIEPSLPRRVDPEIAEPITWTIRQHSIFFVRAVRGPRWRDLGTVLAGKLFQVWRSNLASPLGKLVADWQ